jgi:hypothetical protein
MRKIIFGAAAGSALVFGIAGWATPSNHLPQAAASSATVAQIDTFSMMSGAKDLPIQQFQDFSLVFASPMPDARNSVTPRK